MNENPLDPREYWSKHLEPKTAQLPSYEPRPYFEDGFEGDFSQEQGIVEHTL